MQLKEASGKVVALLKQIKEGSEALKRAPKEGARVGREARSPMCDAWYRLDKNLTRHGIARHGTTGFIQPRTSFSESLHLSDRCDDCL